MSYQIYGELSNYLRSLGLGSLLSIDANGNPRGWLWDQIVSGVDTEEELNFAITQTPEYRERFAVIFEQQQRAAAGESVYVMSPDEVIQYERAARDILAIGGLPPEFYDTPRDLQNLITRDISLDELQDNVNRAYIYVRSAPIEVRRYFEDFYGVARGDAALAAWALDPERTATDITKATRTAFAAGTAERWDVKINRDWAERIADSTMSEAAIEGAIGEVAQLDALTSEGVGEGTDLTRDDTLSSVFGGDADATQRLERRQIQRQANARGGSGGAAIDRSGAVGAGSAS